TICARGMEIAKMMDTKGTLVRLDSFTDKDLFADYAALHASKMVIEGIIKGNPDQTINPLGNTTRAEAAVMMYRIMYKGHVKTKA
ncbi:MAG: S-layer homology domain-containing protein, partial [Clostridia bacterium]|nr:S-layer homology domain-containing protein [Clostridia bacterium]